MPKTTGIAIILTCVAIALLRHYEVDTWVSEPEPEQCATWERHSTLYPGVDGKSLVFAVFDTEDICRLGGPVIKIC